MVVLVLLLGSMAYSSLGKNRGREARCRLELILYTQKPPRPESPPQCLKSFSHTSTHTHTHPYPPSDSGAQGEKCKGQETTAKEAGGREVGGAPRCQSQEWATQTREQGSKEAGFQCHHRLRWAPDTLGQREKGGGGSHYTLRRKWFRARAPRPLSPPNSRQTQNDGTLTGGQTG